MKVGTTTTDRNRGQCSSWGVGGVEAQHRQSADRSGGVTTEKLREACRREDLSQKLVQAEDLRQEDASADEDTRYETQEASQVLGRYFPQIHRYDAQGDSCRGRFRQEVTYFHCNFIFTGSIVFFVIAKPIQLFLKFASLQ